MKKIFTLLSVLAIPSFVYAQSVPSAYRLSQHDLRGTARFMSMGGAFGALGGDLSTLSQNPGGIGIYRSNDIGMTLGLDFLDSKTSSQGYDESLDNTRFNLNSIGGVFTWKLPSSVMPNINFGFTYNKVASFDRQFKGRMPNLQTSLSNYIAGLSNAYGLTEADVATTDNFDPYNPGYNRFQAPWISIIGYDALLTNPEGDPDNPHWVGQFGDGTSGTGYYELKEKGSVDEYNIAIGGNINNVVYWGMDFGITSIDYTLKSVYGESLTGAYVYNPNINQTVRSNADWDIYDNYRVNGTGFNFKLGVIVKPIQELRLGFAFHTPTYYNLNEKYYDVNAQFRYDFDPGYSSVWANDGYPSTNSYNFRTPWRLIGSVAGVVGSNLIVSLDYEWAAYNGMRYSEANNYGYYDPWYDWDDPWAYWAPVKNGNKTKSGEGNYVNPNEYANSAIKQVYKNTNTLRAGVEYRVIPSLSLRAGYSWTSSPIKTEVSEGRVQMPGTGVLTGYTLDNVTNYLTLGLGYRHKGFYADLAYVYRHNSGEYFPFSPDLADIHVAPKAKVSFDSSQVALSIGYKF